MDRPNTAKFLDKIADDVTRYLRIKEKADSYSARAEKMRVNIFVALDRINKDDFALYADKIERITKRLNKHQNQ